MTPTFAVAAHLTHGDCANERVRAAGATQTARTRDLLTYGPMRQGAALWLAYADPVSDAGGWRLTQR
jgi:hypothetical protein